MTRRVWFCMLCSRRARRRMQAMIVLRRAYEHVLMSAVLEGDLAVRRPYYQAYVDAVEVLAAQVVLIARCEIGAH